MEKIIIVENHTQLFVPSGGNKYNCNGIVVIVCDRSLIINTSFLSLYQEVIDVNVAMSDVVNNLVKNWHTNACVDQHENLNKEFVCFDFLNYGMFLIHLSKIGHFLKFCSYLLTNTDSNTQAQVSCIQIHHC